MTLIDYLLLGILAALLIHAVLRLFLLRWGNSALRHEEREKSGEPKAVSEQLGRRVATRAPWTRRAEATD